MARQEAIVTAPAPEFLSLLIAEAGLSVPPGAAEKLSAHAAMMLRWNRAIRLTAITDPEEVAVKHILDSLLLLRLSPFRGRILDFGSGAGYPGIPLAVALPEAQVCFLESSGKKSSFLREVAAALSLKNIQVFQERLGKNPPRHLGRFGQIVTRATLPPAEAASLLLPLLEPGGRLLLMAGAGKETGEEGALPEGALPGRRFRFLLPLGMGTREIREIRAP